MGRFGQGRRWRSPNPGPERGHKGIDAARFALLRAAVILLFGILTLQLINMQVIHGSDYARRAEINALREVPVPAARGLIYDRQGRPLVQNSARFSATIVPGDLPKSGEAGVFHLLSSAIGVPVAEIEQKVREGIAGQGQ